MPSAGPLCPSDDAGRQPRRRNPIAHHGFSSVETLRTVDSVANSSVSSLIEPSTTGTRGFIVEGTTTTPFDMTVRNRASRYHPVMDVINNAKRLPRGAFTGLSRTEVAPRHGFVSGLRRRRRSRILSSVV
jgi:hypothetical protein